MEQGTRVIGHGLGRFTVLRSMQTGGITLNERLFPAGYRERRHKHDQPYFSVVMSGEYSEQDGPCLQIYRGRCLGFQPIGEHESKVFDEPVRTLVIEFPAALASDHSLDRPLAAEAGPTAMRMYHEMAMGDKFSGLAIQGLLLELIAEMGRRADKTSGVPKWLHRAEELLWLRHADALTLEEIAREVGVHPVSLARAFRRQYGVTVGEAIRRYRVEQAQQMIRAGSGSLAEIAAETGFSDQSHFGRVFRRLVGVSPATFRDNIS